MLGSKSRQYFATSKGTTEAQTMGNGLSTDNPKCFRLSVPSDWTDREWEEFHRTLGAVPSDYRS